MITDDPDTPGDGNWEINLSTSAARLGVQRLRNPAHVDVNYGYGERLQLKIEGGVADSDGPGGQHTGIDDLLVGTKWRFIDPGEQAWHVSTYPQLRLQASARAVRDGEAAPAPALFLPLEASLNLGAYTLVTDAGYQTQRTGGNQWLAGILGGWRLDRKLELMAEARYTRDVARGDHDLLLNLGLRRRLGEHLQLLLAAGSALATGIDPTRYQVYLGVQVGVEGLTPR